MDLTPPDIDHLIEALKCWESDDVKATLFATVVVAGMGVNQDKDQMRREFEKRMDDTKKVTLRREERPCVLRAKLIMLRDKITVEKLTSPPAPPSPS